MPQQILPNLFKFALRNCGVKKFLKWTDNQAYLALLRGDPAWLYAGWPAGRATANFAQTTEGEQSRWGF